MYVALIPKWSIKGWWGVTPSLVLILDKSVGYHYGIPVWYTTMVYNR